MLVSKGQVSSKILNVLFFLSSIVMSGLRGVTQISSGTEPPLGVVCPGRSLNTENVSVSRQPKM